VGLADRALALAGRREVRYSADTWLSDYLLPSMEQFVYGGNTYGPGAYGLRQTMVGIRAQEISQSLPGYSAALRQCPPAFAAQMVRALVISQARFTFRNLPSSKTPRKTFGTRALSVLEHPAPAVTTGEMLARMEWHAGLAGNAYVYRQPKRLRVLRPDWVVVIFGSDQEPEDAAHALDGELIGFVYCNGGFGSGNRPQTLLPNDVAHWCPLPDPEMSHIGMSWITPAVREIQNDRAASEHKLRYWTQGATPNLVVKGIPALTKPQFDEIVDAMDARHNGVMNAFKTLYLTAGADATVIGNNFKDMDLKNVIAGGETRIAALSRVPAPILGISEGLAGSSLNAGNFGMARRLFADTWVYPTLQDLSGSLADIVDVPNDAELWFDTTDMPMLREDAKDAAEILNLKISGVTMAVRDGFTAESSIAAAVAGDVSLLKHSGLTSVQLQPPGAVQGDQPDPEADGIAAGIDKFLAGGEGTRARFDPADHPRNPKGSAGGGRFRSVAQRVVDALQEWARTDREGDPFAEFTDREPLRKVAVARGIKLSRGASRDDIAEALKKDLLEHVGDGKDLPDKPEPKKATPPRKAAPKAPAVDLDNIDDPEALRDALDLKLVPELKDMIRKRNETLPAGQKLPVSGPKRALVDRLVEHHGGTKKPAAKAPDKPKTPDAPAQPTEPKKEAGPAGKVRLEPAPTVFGNVKEAHDVFLGDTNVGTVYVGEDGKMTLFPPRGQRGSGRKIQQPAAGATLDDAVKALTDFHQAESSLTPTARAHRHLEALVPDFKGNRVLEQTRAPIMQTLGAQADLVPSTTLMLEGVDYARADADREGMFGWDFGEMARYDQFSNRIALSPDWHDHYLELSEASHHAHASGWHPPSTEIGGPAASMAHEFGHHVVETMRRNGFDERQAGELFGTLERALDLEPGTLHEIGEDFDKATVNLRLAPHGDIIRERISGYAAQPSGDQSSQLDELLAEVWQEYSMMGDKARPHIKEVGAILARLAEEAATR